MWFRLILLVSLGLSFCLPFDSVAQELSLTSSAEEKPAQSHESTPRKTVQAILASVSGVSAEPLNTYFDTRNTSKLRKIKTQDIIDKFPYILDMHGSLTPTGLLSNNPFGSDEQSLPDDYEKVGNIQASGRNIPILLERVVAKSGDHTWLVSQTTIVDLSTVAEEFTESRINQFLPEVLQQHQFRGAPIGQWIGVLVLAGICAVLGWLVMAGLRVLSVRARQQNETSRRSQVLDALAMPLGIVIAIIVLVTLERHLGVSIIIRQDMSVITLSGLWIALFLFIWSLIENLSDQGEKILRRKNQVGGLSVIMFFKASAKAILLVLAFILLLNNLGVDVTTGLAALGIGGIALALGAQKAIENLVGSIIIIIDQPIRVGDFCKVGDLLGTVEHIGLRSTRIRTRHDTLVSFPNGMLSTERIENYSMRRKFFLRSILNLRYETKMEDLENILDQLRTHLRETKFVSTDNQRVRFIAYGAASLDIEVSCYIYAGDYELFLERQERILIGFTEVINTNNSGFAFPSQTVYLSRDEKP